MGIEYAYMGINDLHDILHEVGRGSPAPTAILYHSISKPLYCMTCPARGGDCK